jgi:NTP pyrophosphatase (non-canonical NTP hydrolase)
MQLREYQKRAATTDEKGRLALSIAGLVGEVGSIVAAYKKRLRHRRSYPGFSEDLSEELGDTLWYLASVATVCNISLEKVAAQNLKKVRALYDEGTDHHFDGRYPPDERFPRQFDVTFTEKKVSKRVLVKITVNGVTVGDHLTDNAYDPDNYRFHDAFHLAYVAVLGWSPVIRALLRRKRKSKPIVDENEDGARAIAVEEAISIFLFNQAKRSQNYFEDDAAIGLGLLQTVQGLVGGLEVNVCTAKQWHKAISQGYSTFRQLRDNRGGIVSLDLDKHSIAYRPAPKSSKRNAKAPDV